jgi:hypothetical protein
VGVTQGELNSFLNLSIKLPPGLTDIDFALQQDVISAKAVVDLDRVRGQLPPTGALNPVSYLSGRVPVELEGKLPSDNGFGSIELSKIRLGGLPIPVSLLEQMVLQMTKTHDNPGGFDILSPFRLPYSVRKVRIQPGQALLDF